MSGKKNPRFAGLQPHPEALGVKPLIEGETSQTHRVRAMATPQGWWASLTAEQRGQLVTELYTARRATLLRDSLSRLNVDQLDDTQQDALLAALNGLTPTGSLL